MQRDWWSSRDDTYEGSIARSTPQVGQHTEFLLHAHHANAESHAFRDSLEAPKQRAELRPTSFEGAKVRDEPSANPVHQFRTS